MSRNPHIGSSLDDLLDDDGALEEIHVQAIKRVFAWQLEQARKARGVSKVRMAARMRTSRAAVNRLLDPANPAATLTQMARAAATLGKRLRVELVDARSQTPSAGRPARVTKRRSVHAAPRNAKVTTRTSA